MKLNSFKRGTMRALFAALVVAHLSLLPWAAARASETFDVGQYAGKVVVVDLEQGDAAKFLEEYPAEFAIVYDETKELARQYGVVAMPSSFVIGRDGRITAKHMGFKVKQQDEYEALIVDALLAPGTANE